MKSHKRLLAPVIATVLFVSLLPSVHGQAIGRQVSPFDFQLDESSVDGKRYSYLTGPGPAAIIKQNETKSLPIIILSATDRPIPIKFHVTVGNNQTGPMQMPLGVHAIVEPSEITVKSNQNQTINIIVSVDKNAHEGKYALNIVGEWPQENGFMGSSIVINIGKDSGPDSMPFNFLWTPLKQYESGIEATAVSCQENFVLVTKSEDGSPACVKTSSITRLFSQGWILPDTIKITNSNLSFNYSISGGSVEESRLDTQSKSLIISIKTTNNGTLTITLPRALIDAKMNNQTDDQFFVLADGQEILYKEIHKTVVDRTLSIQFQQGIKKIEIIGTEPI